MRSASAIGIFDVKIFFEADIYVSSWLRWGERVGTSWIAVLWTFLNSSWMDNLQTPWFPERVLGGSGLSLYRKPSASQFVRDRTIIEGGNSDVQVLKRDGSNGYLNIWHIAQSMGQRRAKGFICYAKDCNGRCFDVFGASPLTVGQRWTLAYRTGTITDQRN